MSFTTYKCMEKIGKPKNRWDRVHENNMDRSLPCVLCRRQAIGAGGGCCKDCMMSIMLESQSKKFPVSIKDLKERWRIDEV